MHAGNLKWQLKKEVVKLNKCTPIQHATLQKKVLNIVHLHSFKHDDRQRNCQKLQSHRHEKVLKNSKVPFCLKPINKLVHNISFLCFKNVTRLALPSLHFHIFLSIRPGKSPKNQQLLCNVPNQFLKYVLFERRCI